MSILSDMLLAPEVEDSPSGYLDTLIDQAENIALSYKICDDDGVALTAYPDEGDAPILDALVTRLAIALYRRGGTEHATQVSMGDYSWTAAEIPADIEAALKRRRAPGWL